MKKLKIWDVLLWLGAILILGWALLKSFGIIHSPIWVEMVPYLGVGISIIGGAYKIGKISEKIDKISSIKERFDKLEH